MGKALIVHKMFSHVATVYVSGDEFGLYGAGNKVAAESNTYHAVTEEVRFSNLRARVTGGNSGTATIQFRRGAANGNQVVNITGVDTQEDSSNTDLCPATEIVNYAYTDTGTDSQIGWIACNVQFSDGHGNFHGSSNYNGAVYDLASTTSFIQLGGSFGIDGNTTEADVQWRNRGYSSWEAIEVMVSANARGNDSTFTNRIDGNDGSLAITYASGATGLVTDTSPADSLSDGSLICMAVTLGTGVQDLTIAHVGGTFKSGSGKSETFGGNLTGTARTASATPWICPPGGALLGAATYTDAEARIKAGFEARVSNLRCYISANTNNADAFFRVNKNGVMALEKTIAAGATGWQENSADTVDINDTDELSFEFDEGGTGSMTVMMAGITFGPTNPQDIGWPENVTATTTLRLGKWATRRD